MTSTHTSATDTRSIIATSVVATIGCVYPGFLVGAVSVQVRDEFEVSAGRYGWAMGTYFLAAAFASILGGRLVQRIGPRRQLSGCLVITIVAQGLIATTGDSFGVIVALLAVCGVVNAANQTAVNLALTRARLPLSLRTSPSRTSKCRSACRCRRSSCVRAVPASSRAPPNRSRSIRRS